MTPSLPTLVSTSLSSSLPSLLPSLLPTSLRGGIGPALLSALLLVTAFPPFHLLLPSLVALVPFAVWVARLEAGGAGSRAAARGGLLFGVAHFAVLLYWIVPALAWVTVLAIPAFLAVVGLLAALTAGFGWTLHRAVHGARAPLWLALPVTWTAMEWARAHLPGGLAFPWLELGTSLTGFPEIVGVAELVGTRGVSFWLAAVNGLVAASVVARLRRRREAVRIVPHIVAAALIAVLPAGWGLWRASTLDTRVAARVAIVQPDIPADVKRDPALALERTLAALERLVRRLEPGSMDLVALPEGAFPFDLGAPEAMDAVEALTRHARMLGAPLLVGAYGAPGADGARLNSVFVVTHDGLADYRYDKRRLVPLVERDAWIFGASISGGGRPPFSAMSPPPSAAPTESALGLFRPGTGTSPVYVGGVRVGLLICWEAIFQEDARRHRRAGAAVLVNVTNDAWYGDASGGGPTTALRQHPTHLVMRAIETRMGAARAANTGVSFFVDPVGRIHGELPISAERVGVAEVRTSDVVTLHSRLGDVVGRGSAAAALLLVLWGLGFGARVASTSRGRG